MRAKPRWSSYLFKVFSTVWLFSASICTFFAASFRASTNSAMAYALMEPNLTSKDAPKPALPRRSSSLCRELITKLRPLPLQYVWAVWYSRPGKDYSLSQLANGVADIGAFYRIFNNFPWDDVRLKDSVHFFRAGVEPLWEDSQNADGGCWTIKVRREDGKALKVWEELCLMTCGGELQAEIASERDHVLGISYSPRLYWSHISVWTQKGENQHSIDLLQNTILSRLSPNLQPMSQSEYYYKRHADHRDFDGSR